MITKVERTIDLKPKCPEIQSKIELKNIGNKPIDKFYFAVPNDIVEKAGSILYEGKEKIEKLGTKIHDLQYNATLIEFTLDYFIQPSEKLTITIKELYIRRWIPLPAAIAINEQQFVKFYDNKLFFSPYKVNKQKTTYKTFGIEYFFKN